MERDALLAHGISMCVYDRFMACSDKSNGYICKKCGSLLACMSKQAYLNEDENIQFFIFFELKTVHQYSS